MVILIDLAGDGSIVRLDTDGITSDEILSRLEAIAAKKKCFDHHEGSATRKNCLRENLSFLRYYFASRFYFACKP